MREFSNKLSVWTLQLIDVWKSPKNTFTQKTMDRKLTVHHQLEILQREKCESLNYYSQNIWKYVILAIGKPLLEDRKSFPMLIGLMGNYQMFTTMTLWPLLLEYYVLLSMLHNYETRISLRDSNVVAHQVVFVANKNLKSMTNAQKLTSKKEDLD